MDKLWLDYNSITVGKIKTTRKDFTGMFHCLNIFLDVLGGPVSNVCPKSSEIFFVLLFIEIFVSVDYYLCLYAKI